MYWSASVLPLIAEQAIQYPMIDRQHKDGIRNEKQQHTHIYQFV